MRSSCGQHNDHGATRRSTGTGEYHGDPVCTCDEAAGAKDLWSPLSCLSPRGATSPGVLSVTCVRLGIRGGWHQDGRNADGIYGSSPDDFIRHRNRYTKAHADFLRASARRDVLEKRRVADARTFIPPVEPTREDARRLYKQLLAAGRARLTLTDKEYFRRKLRQEFEVTARKTSARVRGVMYEKGQWMLKHDLGGLR